MSRTPRTPGSPALIPVGGRPAVAICQDVIEVSQQYLHASRWVATEKIVYWAGIKRDGLWLATTVVRPDAVLTRGSFQTTSAANADVVAFLSDAGLSLIAQVHTHPGAQVGHSDGDERDAFMPVENALSLVVPHYCRHGMLPLATCGVHRYEGGRYRRLDAREAQSTLCIVPLSKDFKK